MNLTKGEKKMSETWTIDIYQLLKKGGFSVENKLNGWIKDWLNQEKTIIKASEQSQVLANKITSARQYTELLSTLLNFPTKNELANTSSLILQTDDKVDQLEIALYELKKLTEEIKRELQSNQRVES